jgi:hypothetical protein
VFAVCREDRAFLCRGCDISIHSANAFVAKHERFLINGITLEVESMGVPGRAWNLKNNYSTPVLDLRFPMRQGRCSRPRLISCRPPPRRRPRHHRHLAPALTPAPPLCVAPA